MATVIDRSALIPVSAEKMYALVNDVEAYPAYLAGCTGAEILEQGADFMVARLELRNKGVHYAFTTRNQLLPGREIRMRLESGPFRKLNGRWQFSVLAADACKVSLTLEFEPNSRLLGIAASSLFARVANNMVAAMTERAHKLYSV